MSENTPLSLDVNAGWEADSLRFTCFVQGAPATDQNWWGQICGSPPESSTTRMNGAHRVDQGKYGSGVLYLEVQPGRIDLVLGPVIDEQNPTFEFAVLGPYPKVIIEFEEIIKKWLRLDDLPPIQRVAFGVPAFMAVASLKAGYLKLAGYLKDLKIDPDNSSDLTYQINRPRKTLTTIPSLSINRLSRWSTARLRIYSSPTDVVRTIAVERFACRLELDINTIPEHLAPLPKEMLPTLFSELAALASEIMLKGDIP